MFVFLPQRHRVRDAERCDGLHPPEVQAACSEESQFVSQSLFQVSLLLFLLQSNCYLLSNYVYMVCLCPFCFVFGAAQVAAFLLSCQFQYHGTLKVSNAPLLHQACVNLFFARALFAIAAFALQL